MSSVEREECCRIVDRAQKVLRYEGFNNLYIKQTLCLYKTNSEKTISKQVDELNMMILRLEKINVHIVFRYFNNLII